RRVDVRCASGGPRPGRLHGGFLRGAWRPGDYRRTQILPRRPENNLTCASGSAPRVVASEASSINPFSTASGGERGSINTSFSKDSIATARGADPEIGGAGRNNLRDEQSKNCGDLRRRRHAHRRRDARTNFHQISAPARRTGLTRNASLAWRRGESHRQGPPAVESD